MVSKPENVKLFELLHSMMEGLQPSPEPMEVPELDFFPNNDPSKHAGTLLDFGFSIAASERQL